MGNPAAGAAFKLVKTEELVITHKPAVEAAHVLPLIERDFDGDHIPDVLRVDGAKVTLKEVKYEPITDKFVDGATIWAFDLPAGCQFNKNCIWEATQFNYDELSDVKVTAWERLEGKDERWVVRTYQFWNVQTPKPQWTPKEL